MLLSCNLFPGKHLLCLKFFKSLQDLSAETKILLSRFICLMCSFSWIRNVSLHFWIEYSISSLKFIYKVFQLFYDRRIISWFETEYHFFEECNFAENSMVFHLILSMSFYIFAIIIVVFYNHLLMVLIYFYLSSSYWTVPWWSMKTWKCSTIRSFCRITLAVEIYKN